MELKPGNDALHLHERRDGGRAVVVHPDDNDLFVLTGRQAIESCRLGISIELWLDELNLMLEHVRQWCAERGDKVRDCFVVPHGERIHLYFVPSGDCYDFVLGDEMTQLNTGLVRNSRVGMVDVLQIPNDEIERFVDMSHAKHLFGNTQTPRESVEA